MSAPVSVVVFDVNETLSDMAPMAARFADVGAPASLAATWFASVLRDGFALAVTNTQQSFAVIAAEVLRSLLPSDRLTCQIDAAIDHVMNGFSELSLHPDVVAGIRSLQEFGLRLVTLSNGAAQVAETLFAKAGIAEAFERLLSVEGAGIWKPATEAYAYAARECSTAPEKMMLVAVHPWDIHGAALAGLHTAWINRTGTIYPGHLRSPEYTVSNLGEVVNVLKR